jgi:phosphoribosylamine-glycine ligase
MIEDVQAYGKPYENNHADEDQKDRHSVLSSGGRVIVVVITADSNHSFLV